MKIIDNERIARELEAQIDVSDGHVDEVLAKARELKGIDYNDVLTLLKIEDKKQLQKMFDTAKYIKDEIYGKRLVLFAPLYISNLCNNECTYCAFRAKNNKLVRKQLTQEEIVEETKVLLGQGHKRILMVAGESYPREGMKYIYDSIETIYSVKTDKGSIRRINVNVAPLTTEEFKELHNYNIGTYQIFQETYHEPTYKKHHIRGPKSNYQYRLEAIDRAFEGGFDDVGVGILFGLYDWRYEILALLDHIKHLENKFGIGPHTISVPRLEPALDSDVSYHPPYAVNDEDFKKIIAVLRIAVPYTGIILSTRESSEMRRAAFDLGVSQISAGSRTNPGGYRHDDHTEEMPEGAESQFSLGDTRPLHDVIEDIVDHGFVPSFCTGCYRLGRVGKDFMDLAKPGAIKAHCYPNAFFTFSEYLEDFANNTLKQKGYNLIEEMVKKENFDQAIIDKVINQGISRVKSGERDVYI